jgi:small subunit ribosomal protein S7
MSEILVFGKWSTAGIKVDDPGLQNYVVLEPKLMPKTGARYAGKQFHKSKIFIVERLINKLMQPGHKGKKHFRSSGSCGGKSQTASDVVEKAFNIIEKKTGLNPIAVFVKALENAAPREEIVTIEYGGARYPKAVECAPQRRIDICLRQMVQSAYQKKFHSKKKSPETLADEIILAYKREMGSQAMSKKNELERQADASR